MAKLITVEGAEEIGLVLDKEEYEALRFFINISNNISDGEKTDLSELKELEPVYQKMWYTVFSRLNTEV